MNERYRTSIASPIGDMTLVVAGESLELLDFDDASGRLDGLLARRYPAGVPVSARDPSGIAARITAYFEGELDAIESIAATPRGTPFQETVWRALRAIPCGRTAAYRDIAARIGRERAVRAVGLANGRNPVSVVVPCHRVIGRDGSLTGYGGGLARKAWLLEHEGALPAGAARQRALL